ncbi:DHA2 family efflux MFS transporter permease subunit [Gordonia hydrophobica]|uniref:DHA2 family efflux MFS transporter permease subunit n=1 Tax=Gordonia hydrophobica TaxID=40516 RepID=A0ABZ2U2F5_9ACTN|nr:DHA2 family efflux MFS transporter permease subunit [Gordonia hydrophobica]MBM7369077.1 EmrB/QacA subfamily drug resistance transporter [Gordonia hydrophobica]
MANESVAPIPPEAKRVAVAVVAGLIAPILDTTIVTIAFDRLTTDLGTTVDLVQWVATAYLLALAVGVPLAGWAAYRFGSRRAWRTGLLLFLIGSVLCALSWNVEALIVFRAVQGVGAGLLFPLMTSVLVAASGGQALGRLVAMVSLPTALGPILGPVIGGVILHWLDWQWMFVVNVPICLIALALAGRIPDDRDAAGSVRTRLDVIGLALLAPGLVCVLLGLSNSHNGIVRTDVLIPVIVGLVLLTAFALRSLRAAHATLVDVRVLAKKPVSASSIALFFFSVANFGAMLLLPLYLQQERGETVLAAALILIPQGVGALLSRSIAGVLTDRFGARWVGVSGFAIVAIATVPFAMSDQSTNLVSLMAVLLVRGLGLGTLLSPLMASGFYGVSAVERHDVSIVTRTFQQVGGSFGTAVVAVVLTAGATSGVGFRDAFWWSTALAAVGALLALLLPNRPAPASASGPQTRVVVHSHE